MIDHVSLGVSDVPAAQAFYDRVLAKLGLRRLMGDDRHFAGYGAEKPGFWICLPLDGARPAAAGNGTHLAFAAPNRAAVDAFYAEALAAGARDDGAPGLRRDYHPNYYAAFVIDPFGHKIEAVCHAPA